MHGQRGFSLLEMTAVLAIVGIMMGLLAARGIDWARAERARASAREVVNALNSARSTAIAGNQIAWFRFGNALPDKRGFFFVYSEYDGLVGSTGRLAYGISFDNENGFVAFGPDGRCFDSYPESTNGIIKLAFANYGRAPKFIVSRLTGLTEVINNE